MQPIEVKSLTLLKPLQKEKIIKAAVHIEANEVNILYKILKLRNARWWKKKSKEQIRAIQSENFYNEKDGSFTKRWKPFC